MFSENPDVVTDNVAAVTAVTETKVKELLREVIASSGGFDSIRSWTLSYLKQRVVDALNETSGSSSRERFSRRHLKEHNVLINNFVVFLRAENDKKIKLAEEGASDTSVSDGAFGDGSEDSENDSDNSHSVGASKGRSTFAMMPPNTKYCIHSSIHYEI